MVIMVVVLLVLAAFNTSLLVYVLAKHRATFAWTTNRVVALERAVGAVSSTVCARIDASSTDLRKTIAERSKVDAHAQHVKAADMGIALAERMARLHPAGAKGEKLLTSADKAKMAVDWAVEHCQDAGTPIDPAAMRKIVEIRLEQVQPAKKR